MFVDDEANHRPIVYPAPSHSKDVSTTLCAKILVVDDCFIGRGAVIAIFRNAGHTVETAENGLDACQRALAASDGDRPFDLIVMDMNMPVMDGYAATSYLRECGYCGRIVALTGASNEDVREQSFIAGCDDFATKPITLETLLDLVKRNFQAPLASISFTEARRAISASRIGPASRRLCA